MYTIKTLNAISPVGLAKLNKNLFDVAVDADAPDGILVRSADLLNTTFHTDINWLGKNPYAWITIFVLVLWAGIGGNLVIYRSALSGVDESLYEAAKVDGAGPVRIFFSITLPEIKLPLFYTTIMTTTGAFNVWGQPVMLTNGGPNYQTQVLLMDIRNLAFPAGPAAAGMASAMALLLGIILMAIAAIQLIFMNKED